VGMEVAPWRDVVSDAVLPALVVGRREGRRVSVVCLALARREATPSENEGMPVRPESLGGTGCTPIITNGIIRDSGEFESDVTEGLIAGGTSGIGACDSTSRVVGSGNSVEGLSTMVVGGDVRALNRYINK